MGFAVLATGAGHTWVVLHLSSSAVVVLCVSDVAAAGEDGIIIKGFYKIALFVGFLYNEKRVFCIIKFFYNFYNFQV